MVNLLMGLGLAGFRWPLLTSERAHYELAAGNRQEAIRLMQTVEQFSNDGGLSLNRCGIRMIFPRRTFLW